MNKRYIATGAITVILLTMAAGWFYADSRQIEDNAIRYPATAEVSRNWSDEVVNIETTDNTWPGTANYSSKRIGADAIRVLKTITADDRLVFSNLWLNNGIELADARVSIELIEARNTGRFARFDREIVLATAADGSRTLFFGALPGRVYLRHFQLMVKDYLARQNLTADVLVIEDEQIYQRNYLRLAQTFSEAQAILGRVDAVLVGWVDQAEAVFGSRKLHIQLPDSPWELHLFELENGVRLVGLSSLASWHGEILGQSLAHLIDRMPSIRSVFMGGSGGSLRVADLYSLAFPSEIDVGEGSRIPNIISKASEWRLHRSVVSPLEETDAYLADAEVAGVDTVDMEMRAIARAMAVRDVATGFAVLITDFPIRRQETAHVSINQVDNSRKYENVQEYFRAVRDFLLGTNTASEVDNVTLSLLQQRSHSGSTTLTGGLRVSAF